MHKNKIQSYIKRRKGVRSKVVGTKARPRLCVFRSNKYIYAQLIDDENATTAISVNEKDLKGDNNSKTKRAEMLGELLAARAKAKKIKKVVFDRGGYKYHGRVKAVAEGARKGGLDF